MAKLSIKPGSTDVSLLVWVQDSASTTGGGKTGIAYNASGLTAYYARPGEAAAAITLATQTVTGAHSDGGWVEVDATNMPGLYRLDLPDAVVAAGVRSAVVHVKGASGMAPLLLEIDIASQVDAVAISGDATAADNLEAQFDGTGLTGDTYPSTQAQVGNIATTGAAAYQAAASFTKTVGGTETLTYAATDTSNGVYHQVTDSAGALDVYYEYTLREDEVAVGVQFKGRMNGAGDNVAVQAYDWVGAGWVTLFSLNGVSTTTDTTQTPSLVSKYTGTSTNVGKVRIRFYAASGLTSATLYVDQCIVAKASTSRTVGYSQGAIWIDSTNGVAGTTTYFNGTADHPVSTWADALTLAAALSIYRFQVAPGTTITLAASAAKYALAGKGWKLALGGQDLSYATIDGCELVTGIATSATWEMFFWNCQMGACTLGEADLHNCHVTDVITLGASAPYLFNGCVGVPIGTPGVDFDSLGGATVVIGNARGVWTIANMAAGDTLYVDGNGELTIAASCTGGVVYVSGGIHLTNNGSGQTIYDTSRFGEDQTIGLGANALTAAALATDAVTEIADGVLARDIGSGTNAGTLDERTVRSALRFLRNKWSVAGTTLTVTAEDDATTAWTSALSSSASAEPVTGSDPS